MAATTRTSTRCGRVSPTGKTSPCSRNRSNFGWTSSGRSPTSSRKSVPPSAVRSTPGLVGDGAREAAAAVAEELTVGELARRARAVVGQEHAAAARRPGVDRPRDEILAGAALAGDEHREVVALHALNLIGDALHRGARADKSRQERLERPLEDAARRLGRAIAGGAEIEPLPQHGAERAEPLAGAAGERPAARHESESRPVRVAAERLDRHRRRGPGGQRARRANRQLARARRIAAGRRGDHHLSRCRLDEDHGRLRVARFEEGRRALAREQRRHDRRIHDAADERVLAVHLDADIAAGRRPGTSRRAPAAPRPDPAPRRGPRRWRSRRSR